MIRPIPLPESEMNRVKRNCGILRMTISDFYVYAVHPNHFNSKLANNAIVLANQLAYIDFTHPNFPFVTQKMGMDESVITSWSYAVSQAQPFLNVDTILYYIREFVDAYKNTILNPDENAQSLDPFLDVTKMNLRKLSERLQPYLWQLHSIHHNQNNLLTFCTATSTATHAEKRAAINQSLLLIQWLYEECNELLTTKA